MPKWLRQTLLYILVAIGLFALFLLISSRFSPEIIRELDDAGIILGYILACLAAAIGILEYRHWHHVRTWFERLRTPGTEAMGVPYLAMRDKTKAMVIPLSNRDQPEWVLRHLKPERVSLLYSEDTQKLAEELASEFGTEIIFDPSREQMERAEYRLVDPWDPFEAREFTNRFVNRFRQSGYRSEEIVVDTTAGTKPMSIGLFGAAEAAGVSSIYVLGTASKEGDTRKHLIADPEKFEHGDPRFLSDRMTSSSEQGR